jgi:ATP-binding cassette, subfamily B, bacterial
MDPMYEARPRLRQEILAIVHCGLRVWRLVPFRSRCTLGGAVAIMLVGGVVGAAIPVLLGRAVDSIADPSAASYATSGFLPGVPRPIVWFLGLLGAAYLIREALQVVRRYLVEETSTRLEKHLFVMLVAHVLTADLNVLTREKVGVLHGRIARSVGGGVRFLRATFLDFLPALASGSLALATAFATDWKLGLLMAGIIPLSLGITVRQLNSQRNVRLTLMRSRERIDGIVVERLGGIEQIRVADTHRREVERLAIEAELLRGTELRHHFVMSLFGSTKAICEAAFHLLVVGASLVAASRGAISVGDVLLFSMLFLNVMAPLNEVHRVIDEGHESSLLVEDLLRMLAEPADRSFQSSSDRQPRSDLADFVNVDALHVDYGDRYETGESRPTLFGASLTVRRGEIVGIAGRSGCGKTTLLRTLLRLVHPTSGGAEVAGLPLEATSRRIIADLTSYVSQSPYIFSGTIEENIAYERTGARPEEIRAAAEAAGLHDEIVDMPGGYQAAVAERGKNLSGGQRQRLALARALLKNAPLLILDEATSSLDVISEGHVHRTLSALRGERTVIMVAHRLSTLLHTDRIFVCDEGRIVETGTYHDLVRQGGLFAELVRAAEDVHYLHAETTEAPLITSHSA